MSADKAEAIETAKKPAEGAGKQGPSIGKRITRFLISMKLALTLLFVIAILSIIGTILPQGDDLFRSDWVKNPLYDFYKNLGLFNMYRSWWFLTILTLLGLNLTVCIINRLPTAVKHAFQPRLDVKDAFVANQPESAAFPGAGDQLEIAAKAIDHHHYKIYRGQSGSILAQRGRFSGLFSIAFHLSFLVLGLGALMGVFFGFNETISVGDGRTVNIPNTDYQVKNNGFKVDYEPVKDGDRITGYKPSVYSSDLEVTENGQKIDRKTITVNDPLKLKTIPFDPLQVEGVIIHQASYDQDTQTGAYISILQVNKRPGKTIVYIGFFMMMIGSTFGMYLPNRRIWLKADGTGGLLMGGRTNRSKLGFQREFERITAELRLRLGQEASKNG